MVRKLSFINYNGGVGRTSLVVHLAASLAEAGKRVLLGSMKFKHMVDALGAL